jgi:hypothetical protein
MDLHEVHTTLKYLIRDRDSTYTAAFDAVLPGSGIAIIKTAIQVPRMNAIKKRWIRTCRAELLDRTLIVNQAPCYRRYANTNRSTTNTDPTAHYTPQHHYSHSPSQSANQTNSTTSTSNDVIDSAASSTNTITRPDQHGWTFRHLQLRPLDLTVCCHLTPRVLIHEYAQVT